MLWNKNKKLLIQQINKNYNSISVKYIIILYIFLYIYALLNFL